MITSDRIIIDGYALLELAREQKRPSLHCIEYDLSETEALKWLLHRHRGSAGLNDYSRIMLALDLEPELTEKARKNKQIGGQQKGWSNLTKAEQVHVRYEIARAAGVSVGNVTKVKQLNTSCVPDLIKALYDDEISIHWAWKLRDESPEDQLDALGRQRFERGLRAEVRQRASRRRRESSVPQNTSEIVKRLTDLGSEKLEAVRVTILKGFEPEIFITEALAQIIGWEQLKIWNQSVGYSISPHIAEGFGIRPESGERCERI